MIFTYLSMDLFFILIQYTNTWGSLIPTYWSMDFIPSLFAIRVRGDRRSPRFYQCFLYFISFWYSSTWGSSIPPYLSEYRHHFYTARALPGAGHPQHAPFPFVAQWRLTHARDHPRRSLPFAFRHRTPAKSAPFHHALADTICMTTIFPLTRLVCCSELKYLFPWHNPHVCINLYFTLFHGNT